MSFTKIMAASALSLSALTMIGCGSNSGSPNRYPSPVVTRPAVGGVGYRGGVVGGGTYVEEGYVAGGGPGGPGGPGGQGGFEGDEEGGYCSAQNIDAALQQCDFRSEARGVKQALLQSSSQDGQLSPEVFAQLGRRVSQTKLVCLREILCNDQQEEEPQRQVRRRPAPRPEVPESTDVQEEKPLRKKF